MSLLATPDTTHHPASPLIGTPVRDSASSSPRPSQPSRKGRRDLLKDYYGLAESTVTEKSAAVSSTTSAQIQSDATSPMSVATELFPKRADPIDNDSEAYHPELALNKMLKEMTLPELIKKDNQLVSEIKDLDGSMKTLVYENYSKFISATDTIRKMKVNAEEMETQISLLEKRIGAITGSAENIHATLAPQRAKIHQLSGVHNLIKKLNFLFELPNKLTECVKAKQYSQAVAYYAKTGRLLTHYKHMQIFRQIEEECALIIADVGRRVREKFEADKASIHQITENVGLMIGLGSSLPLDLAKEYISRVSIQFNKKFKLESAPLIELSNSQMGHALPTARTTLQVSESALSNQPSSETNITIGLISKFNTWFLGELCIFVDSFDVYFLRQYETPANFPLSSQTRDSLNIRQSVLADSRSAPINDQSTALLKASLNMAQMSQEDREEARRLLFLFIEQTQSAYFSLVETLLQLPNDISRALPTLYVEILATIRTDITKIEAISEPSLALPFGADGLKSTRVLSSLSASMNSRLDEMSIFILNKIIFGVFGKVRQEFSVRWKEVQITSQVDVFTTVRYITSWIKETLIAHALPILENFIFPEPSQQVGSKVDVIAKQIRDTLLVFWTDLGNDMLRETSADLRFSAEHDATVVPLSTLQTSKTVTEPMRILILSRLALEWSKGSIESVFSMYAERILMAGSPHDVANDRSGASSPSKSSVRSQKSDVSSPTITLDQDLMSKAHEIASTYRRTSQSLLLRYVQIHVCGITNRIKKYMDDLLRGAVDVPIRSVSKIWLELSIELQNIQRDVKSSIDEESTGDSRRRSLETTKRARTNFPGLRNSGSAMISNGGSSANTLASSGGSNISLGISGRPTATLRYASSMASTGSTNGAYGLGSGGNGNNLTRPTTIVRHAPFAQFSAASNVPARTPERFESLLNDIDKLFEERVEYLPSVIEFSRSAVMSALAKMIIKCLTEQVRVSVLPGPAFQQIQVDVAYLRTQYWCHIKDERLLTSLLDTCIHNASQRCLDPIVLDSLVIDKVISLFIK
ncbi:hypothetical protein BATDEDRAFT_88626 [Batrachochytrium dendrobatidis JAM81]|uniref:Uncharacterized protein n=1 Tax=Batrachochytrium dendrobatidis (strain JAM81 / FGSC 10211) TaxID=684364 RepID=F4P3G5_BATDJ|nr:uncharacterized protein BATDEDRAFT_88626 [Batrachochytrium dendrobatidis JAM81]EGF80463.1 hypothetical protein BATDEDRAFT_88626 [Batrachochytrium dendrobatidis JAM81]|eukprot:XP_006679291.1 hypothetical protein BATDEDRAFT_88626 [Batrachochytrium dendrobatidis JAM81]